MGGLLLPCVIINLMCSYKYVPEPLSESALRHKMEEASSILKYNAVEVKSFADKSNIQADFERNKHLKYPIEDTLNAAYDKMHEAARKHSGSRVCIRDRTRFVDTEVQRVVESLMPCDDILVRGTHVNIKYVTDLNSDIESTKNDLENMFINCARSPLGTIECVEETSTKVYNAAIKIARDVETKIADAKANYKELLTSFDSCAKPHLDHFNKQIEDVLVPDALACIRRYV